jgi:hypothetical protein
MRIAAILALSTFALGGCLTPADEFRNALPGQSDVEVKVPQEGGGAAGSHELALIGERAVLYQVTRDISRAVNGGTWILLKVLEAVVEYEPTTITESQATWGPHTPALSPLSWRMIVEKVGDGQFEFSLDARPKDGDDSMWVAILSGNSHVVDQHRSSGVLVAHCDDANALDPYEFHCTGLVTANWNVESEPRALTVSFRGWSDGDFYGEPIDADYSYLENDDQSGEFTFGATADLDDEGGAAEEILVTSRWDASGAGRGDAFASGGDIPADVDVTITECWDRSFGRSYYTDSVGFAASEGDPAACTFSDAKLPQAQ